MLIETLAILPRPLLFDYVAFTYREIHDNKKSMTYVINENNGTAINVSYYTMNVPGVTMNITLIIIKLKRIF